MRRLINRITPNIAERYAQKNWSYRLRVILLATASIGLTGAGGALYIDREQITSKLYQLGAEAGLKLRYVQVRGRSHISKDALLNTLSLELNAPIFSINLHDMHSDSTVHFLFFMHGDSTGIDPTGPILGKEGR